MFDTNPDAATDFRWPLDAPECAAQLLKVLPAAVYVCDASGLIVGYNDRAAELWGRRPKLGDPAQRFCGSHRLYWPDGRHLPHDQTPMRDAIVSGTVTKDAEVIFERPDGSRFLALVNIVPIRNAQGAIVGAVNCFQDITERKQAEEKVRESQKLLRAVIDMTPECIKVVASDGRLLEMNPSGLQMVDADDMSVVQGRSVLDLVAPEDRDEWRAHHERVCQGERLCWQFDVIGLSGARRHMETHAAPLQMPDGAVAQLAITRDISGRRRAEAALRQSEQRLRELLEALPAAVYTTDAAGIITYYNEVAVHLWGYRPELGSDKWCGSWRLYWPNGTPMPHDECPMAVALKENRTVRGAEAVAERPDGSRVPFMAYPTPLRDDSGKLVGAVNMLVDISERKRAEQAAQQLAAIVESSDDAIASKDLNGILATWNKGAERLFGYTAEEVIGKPVTILIPPERHNEEPEILRRIRRGERVEHYETVRRRKDGSLVDISLTISPVKDGNGRIVGASKIARDISERKRAEQRLQLLAREVDHRAKNMLAVIQSVVQLTRAETVSEFVTAIEGRIRALAHAHSLLSESRWEGADLKHLIAEELAPYCDSGAPRVDLDGPTLKLMPSAAQAIAMVFHELATNAAKYGALSATGGHISIRWFWRADGQLVLCWTETGGPPVQRPSRRGFGTGVIERTINDQLEGAVHFDWRPQGLICEIGIPADATVPSSRTAAE